MNKLTPKQLKAIPLMAQGMSGKEIAEEVSVTPQTVSEWKKLPAFMASVNSLRKEALSSARCQLQQTPNKAIQTLIDLMDNSANDETRRKAALDILRLNGFEPGKDENYARGIGPTNVEDMTHKMNGTMNIHKMLKGFV